MKVLKYIVVLFTMMLSLVACEENVDDIPPRVTDIQSNFILPAPPKLTNTESDMVQAKREAYNEAYGE